MARDFTIPNEGRTDTPSRRYDAAAIDAPVLILAHGAGAGQRSPFMTRFAEAIAGHGVTTITFDFPYVAERRRVPDRAPVLEATWRAVIAHVVENASSPRVVIGGKSMGGRMASHVLTDGVHPVTGVCGLVLLGYPLHPPGRPDRPRIAHLPELRTPTLIVQGSVDAFGTEAEVREAFRVAPGPVDWFVVPDGDHSFKVPRRGGRGQDVVLAAIYETVGRWIHGRVASTGGIARADTAQEPRSG